ncbi:MAG: OmpH family outer membrane protein [Bacteroidia bacterium]|nr:OmpH family outer membrane protein [Bacteroidia bacterium]MDW8159415.1 OmpH family outer membrane protein [Bacteroidia bacterium]
MKVFLIASIYLFFLGLTFNAKGQPKAQRLAYVDVELILSNMSEFKSMQQTLMIHRDKLAQQLAVRKNYFEEKYQEYVKLMEGSKILEQDKKAKEEELRKLQQEVETFQEEAEKNILKKQEELMKPIIEKIQSAVDAVANEEGYTYVFNKSTSGTTAMLSTLIKAPKEDDLTAKVAKKLGVELKETPNSTSAVPKN